MRAAAKGLPVVIVNPSFVLGPRRPEPERDLECAGPPPAAAPHPGLPRRSDQHRRRARRRQGPRPRRRARGGRRALPAHRPELHPAAALRRPEPDRRSAAASGPDPGPPGPGGRRGDGAGRADAAHLRRRGPLRHASGSPTATTRRASSSAGSRGRTRRPSRTRSTGSSSSSASAPRATGSPTWRCAAPAASSPASLQLMSEPRRVLYRCGTPTNFLCPCGAVARRLNKLGLEYRTERVRCRRSPAARRSSS